LVSRSHVPVRIEIDPARMRPNDVPAIVGDYSGLERTTGWKPEVSFDRMLDDLLTYWRTNA
jgi:GDP-4-dehydro-6-deoxy-D-mannose reductase